MSFKNPNYKKIINENLFKPSTSAAMLNLDQCLSMGLLRCIDRNEKLCKLSGDLLADGNNSYEIVDGCPILYPLRVQQELHEKCSPFKNFTDPLLQYVLLSQIKQSGEINAPSDSIPYRKHQWRFGEFCKGLKGLVLDIGRDVPNEQSTLQPSTC